MTVVGLHDFVKVSISEEFNSFLLIICIDAPGSTTNSRSSSLRFDAGKQLFSEGEKNAALWCSFIFNAFLASFHAASRAHRSCHSVSSWDRSSNFVALGLRSWGSPGQIISGRRILVSNVSVTYNGFREFYTSDWSPYVRALPWNRWRLRRLHVLEYATQLSCIWWVIVCNGSHRSVILFIVLQHSHCTFVTILFEPFCLAVHQPDGVRTRTSPQIRQPLLVVQNKHSGGCHFSQNELLQVHLRYSLHGHLRHSTTGTFLWDFGFSTHFSHSASWKNSEKDSTVSILHAYWYRDGNCNCLL